MKVVKKIIALLLIAFSARSFNLWATTEKSADIIPIKENTETHIFTKNSTESVTNNLKFLALSKILNEQKQREGSRIKMVHFYNNIPEMLILDERFSNPGDLYHFLQHFDFYINEQLIPINESKALTIRTDKPFTFRIKAKRGKLESLLAFVKTSTEDWIKRCCAKAGNLLSFGIRYNCRRLITHEDLINHENIDTHYNRIFMDELVYHHPDMREILKNPSNIMSNLKKYLTWSEWFGLEAQLPELNYEGS